MNKVLLFAAFHVFFSFGNSQSGILIDPVFTPDINITFNATFQCGNGKSFCGMGRYVKWTPFLKVVDLGSSVPLQCTEKNGAINHEITINIPGIRGLSFLSFKVFSQPLIYYYHNCEGVIRQSHHFLPTVWLSNKTAAVNYTWIIPSDGGNTKYKHRRQFYIDDALQSKKMQDPKLKQKTFEWLSGEKSALEAINYLKSNGTDESAIRHVPIKSYAVYKNITVTYNGTLSCNSGKRFCAVLYYKEQDFFTSDDLDIVPLNCSDTGTLNHTISVNFIGGDSAIDFYNQEYEPIVEIYHDCGRGLRLHEVPLPEVRMYSSRTSFNYSENLLDKGSIMARLHTSHVLRADILKKDPELKTKTLKWYMGKFYPETSALKNDTQAN